MHLILILFDLKAYCSSMHFKTAPFFYTWPFFALLLPVLMWIKKYENICSIHKIQYHLNLKLFKTLMLFIYLVIIFAFALKKGVKWRTVSTWTALHVLQLRLTNECKLQNVDKQQHNILCLCRQLMRKKMTALRQVCLPGCLAVK